MADSRKMKNMVIFTLLIVIFIMVTGIVVLAHNNYHIIKPGSGSNNKDFRIEFTAVKEHEKRGNVTSKFEPYYVGTNAFFEVEFIAPGDFITYVIQVSNLGNVDAELEDIVYVTAPNRGPVKYEVLGIKEGFELKRGKSYNFKVRVYYETDASSMEEFNKPIQINFNFEQDD